MVDIAEFLRVAIHQRKPTALHLHHNPVASAKGVTNVRHGPIDARSLSGAKWLRLFVTIAELAPHWLAAHELLIATHLNVGRIGTGIGEIV